MKLIEPNLAYQQQFSIFYHDFAQNDPSNAEYYREGVDDFPRYVRRLTDEALGRNLRDDYVPCNHYWCVSSSNEIAGIIRVRHRIDTPMLSQEGGHIGYDVAPSFRRRGYASWMLQQALPIALHLGIERALVTADEENIASRKVIENNGGQLESIRDAKILCDRVARYWVPCEVAESIE